MIHTSHAGMHARLEKVEATLVAQLQDVLHETPVLQDLNLGSSSVNACASLIHEQARGTKQRDRNSGIRGRQNQR